MHNKLLFMGIVFFAMLNSLSAEECPFCDLNVKKKHTVFEGSNFFVLLNHAPITHGHVMIIPKEHIERVDGIPSEYFVEFADLVKKTARVYKKALDCNEYVILQKNGPYAGQTVMHAHFHLIPVQSQGSKFLAQTRVIFKSLFYSSPESNKALKQIRNTLRKAFDED